MNRTAVTLSIVIPTFNEERTIEELVRRLLAVRFPVPVEVVLVDDRSQDRTHAIERRLRDTAHGSPIRVLRNRVNKGKGACIRQGLKHAGGELVVVQDGDLEYDPRDLPSLLGPLLHGKAEAVYGSRFLRSSKPDGMAWPNLVANRWLTWLTNVLYGTRLTDMETCYKIVRRDRLMRLKLRAARFEFEPEVTAKLAKSGVTIVEQPIGYHGRTRREGKKIRAKDFFIAVWVLLRCRFAD